MRHREQVAHHKKRPGLIFVLYLFIYSHVSFALSLVRISAAWTSAAPPANDFSPSRASRPTATLSAERRSTASENDEASSSSGRHVFLQQGAAEVRTRAGPQACRHAPSGASQH